MCVDARGAARCASAAPRVPDPFRALAGWLAWVVRSRQRGERAASIDPDSSARERAPPCTAPAARAQFVTLCAMALPPLPPTL